MQNNITEIINKKRKNKQKNVNNCEILSHKEKKCTKKLKYCAFLRVKRRFMILNICMKRRFVYVYVHGRRFRDGRRFALKKRLVLKKVEKKLIITLYVNKEQSKK